MKQMELNEVGAIVLHVYLDPMPRTMYDLGKILEKISVALDGIPQVRERTLVRAETFKATWDENAPTSNLIDGGGF